MHGHVDVGRPHLGLQSIVGVNSVVFQAATLLQMGLEFCSASPENGKNQGNDKKIKMVDTKNC